MDEESLIRELMKVPGINDMRARSLYEAGYTDPDHFKDAIVQDLTMVPMINPTLARRIISYFRKEYVPEDEIIMVDTAGREVGYGTVEAGYEADDGELDHEGYRKINRRITSVWTLRYFIFGAFYIWISIGLIGLMLLFLIGPLLLLISIGLTGIMIIIALAYANALYMSFRYKLDVKNVIVERGVLFLRKSVIPYDRIQNVNIIQGPFERMYGLKAVEIETAGGSKMVAAGFPALMFSVAEGLIPGLTDPEILSKDILSRKERFDSGL